MSVIGSYISSLSLCYHHQYHYHYHHHHHFVHLPNFSLRHRCGSEGDGVLLAAHRRILLPTGTGHHDAEVLHILIKTRKNKRKRSSLHLCNNFFSGIDGILLFLGTGGRRWAVLPPPHTSAPSSLHCCSWCTACWYFYTVVRLLLHCCYTVITLLLDCCHTPVTGGCGG
jgi:hypothetical protein